MSRRWWRRAGPGASRPVAMEIGVVYPQTELPTDLWAVRAYVQGVEGLG